MRKSIWVSLFFLFIIAPPFFVAICIAHWSSKFFFLLSDIGHHIGMYLADIGIYFTRLVLWIRWKVGYLDSISPELRQHIQKVITPEKEDKS